MRSRKLRWVVAGLVTLAVGAVLLWSGPNRITRANCDRIQFGMTYEQAVAILGPPGDYRTGSKDPMAGNEGTEAFVLSIIEAQARFRGERWGDKEAFVQTWVSDWGQICVVIRANTVQGVRYWENKEPSSFVKLVWRLRQQWRSWFPEKNRPTGTRYTISGTAADTPFRWRLGRDSILAHNKRFNSGSRRSMCVSASLQESMGKSH